MSWKCHLFWNLNGWKVLDLMCLFTSLDSFVFLVDLVVDFDPQIPWVFYLQISFLD